MNRFARVVLGYHACNPKFARQVASGRVGIPQWRYSTNKYDWLGHGIYFWEFGPERAVRYKNRRAVVGAVIQLGNCLDLTDVESTDLLADEYEAVRESFAAAGEPLPGNEGLRGDLDCVVINRLLNRNGDRFDTVRAPFLEGDRAYPESRIYRKSHIQLVVRNRAAILGVFRPTPKTGVS